MKQQQFSYALGVVEAVLASLDDDDKKWFNDRGVSDYDLDNLRLASKLVSSSFYILPRGKDLRGEPRE